MLGNQRSKDSYYDKQSPESLELCSALVYVQPFFGQLKQVTHVASKLHWSWNSWGLETCNSHMFALSDARDYSFSKVRYLEREETTDQSNFEKQPDIILLQLPAPAWKKWPTNGRKTPEGRESLQRLKPGILPKHWAGYYCLTTRAKRNIMKPIREF